MTQLADGIWQVATRPRWVGYASAITAVAFTTGLISIIQRRTDIGNVSMLYMIAVLAAATIFGSGPAVLAAVASFLAFNWFFVEPFYTLTVANPAEWLALLLFLITALVTGQLAASQRERAQEARQRQRESIVLYDVVRLMSERGLEQALDPVAERLRQELGLAAVVIEVNDEASVANRAVAGTANPELNGTKTTEPSRIMDIATGRWIRIVTAKPSGATQEVQTEVNAVPLVSNNTQIGNLLLTVPAEGHGFNAAENRLLAAAARQISSAAERSRLRREATEAEILRRTDELKTALLNAVSHDLRTPLATIIASAGSLIQKDITWTGEEIEEFAVAIEQEAQRLNSIVGNLLDLSRIEGGTLRPDKGWHDLASLVNDVVSRLRSETAERNIIVDFAEELPPVHLDYIEIDQVLTNLIENAAKYSPARSDIRVSVHAMDSWVQVQVDDEGLGIPPQALPRLFEPFYRGDLGVSRPKGIGLGLAVAKGLVEAHGGQIWAKNRPGGGASFGFKLRLETPPVEVAR